MCTNTDVPYTVQSLDFTHMLSGKRIVAQVGFGSGKTEGLSSSDTRLKTLSSGCHLTLQQNHRQLFSVLFPAVKGLNYSQRVCRNKSSLIRLDVCS